MRIAVIGAGSWGTTLADHLAREGHQVAIWAYESEVADSINREHENVLYLAGAALDPGLRASNDIPETLAGAELIVSATPSHAVRQISRLVADALDGHRPPPVVSVSKGLEHGTLDLMTEVLAENVPDAPIVALSGPSFAQEVHRRQPTAVVVASHDHEAAVLAQQTFTSRSLRVYTSPDVLGVQLGGALKNVIAIAAGMLDGLGLGHNTRAALLTRGLAEMTRLGEALGASASTFAGLAGMGDLILTATGDLSRNRTLGKELAKGRTLDAILSERRTVAEGVGTARAAVALGERGGVEMPIANEVSHILFDGKPPDQAVRDLMEREPKPELWR